MKISLAIVCGVLFLCVAAQTGHAQLIHEGSQFVGVGVDLNLSETDYPIGVNYEYIVKREFGIGGVFRYWQY